MPNPKYRLDQISTGAARVRRDVRYNEKRREQHRMDASLGDLVRWKGSNVFGTIVEVVPLGKYPEKKWPGLVIKGFYREIPSYVVQKQDGKCCWPWPASLQLCNGTLQSSTTSRDVHDIG